MVSICSYYPSVENHHGAHRVATTRTDYRQLPEGMDPLRDSLSEAIKDAVTIEYALHFDRSSAEIQAAVFPPEPINMLSGGGKQGGQKEEYTKLQKTVEALTKQLECLETNLQKSLTPSPSRNYQTPRQNRGPRRRQPIGPCYRCGQEGHYYRQYPLNYHWPASKVDNRWPQNQ